MNVGAYLRRINFEGSAEPTTDTLIRLHKAHLYSVPFENLDIHLGRRIVLDKEKLLRKLVQERRGGFCYELNGAFCCLLRELGFEVSMLSASVARDDGGYGPPFDHMALLVRSRERWLADVGFGDSFRVPLRLDERGEQQQDGDAFRLVEAEPYLILERREGELWKAQYRFTLEPHDLADYAEMCLYHQTSPESTFTQRRTCTLATPHGRITVTGMRLILTERGRRNECELNSDAEWAAALREYFGIHLPYTRKTQPNG